MPRVRPSAGWRWPASNPESHLGPSGGPRTIRGPRTQATSQELRDLLFHPLQPPSPRPAHLSHRAQSGTASAQTPPLGGLLSSPRGPAQLPSHPTRPPGVGWISASGVGGIIHFCSLHSCQPAAHLQCPGSAWGQWTARPAVKGLRSAQPKTGGGFPDSPGSLVSSDNLPMNLLVVTLQSSGPGSSCKNAPPSQPYPKALNSSEVLHII